MCRNKRQPHQDGQIVSRSELKNVIRKECGSQGRRDRNSALTVARKMQKSGEKK
jgi:hypothetical protein